MLNEISVRATQHVMKLEKLQGQLNEIEDLMVSIKTPALNNRKEIMTDLMISVPTFNVNQNFIPIEERRNTRWHEIRLEDDLGITDVQPLIKELLIISLEDRKNVLEKQIESMIYKNEDTGVNY